MKRFKEWMGKRALAVEAVDITSGHSRAARFGKRAMMTALIIDAVEPVLTLLGVILLTSVPAMAQTGGGSIFGQDQSMVPNAVRQTVIFMSGIAFLVGAGACIWGAFNYTRRQECMNQFIGGGMLMTIGGIIALISYLSGGRAVTVNREL